MPNLPVPIPASVAPGNYLTSALWNANAYNGLTYLLNRPMADLYQTTAQSIPNATGTAVAFDTTTVDTYGGHSNTVNNSRYTCQAGSAGWYWVYGVVLTATSGSGFRSASVAKNGTAVNAAFATAAPTTSYYGSAVVCSLVQLAVGDYVELNTYQTSGGALNTVTGGGQCSTMKLWWMHA